MDLSKLPKLSDTQSQIPPAEKAPAGAETNAEMSNFQTGVPNYQQPMSHRPPGVGGEIWISLIVGLILAYMGGTFAKFAVAKITHQHYHSGYTWDSDGPKGNAGDEIAYFDLPGFTAWTDMGVFLFGLTLLFEAAAKTFLVLRPGAVSRLVLMLAVVLTFVAVILNVIACVKLLGVGITPLISGLAGAFGGWILFDEWATLIRTQPRRQFRIP